MSAQGPNEAAASSVWASVSSIELPAKKYFKIGEVAQLVGVEPHVLRYWQTQFPQVRPQKSRSGHRLYKRRDLETLLAIRELLHVQRFTIAGARQALRSQHRPGVTSGASAAREPEADTIDAMPAAASLTVDAFRALHEESLFEDGEAWRVDATQSKAPPVEQGVSPSSGARNEAYAASPRDLRDAVRPMPGPVSPQLRAGPERGSWPSGEETGPDIHDPEAWAEVDVVGLEREELIAALERQLAESSGRAMEAVTLETGLFAGLSGTELRGTERRDAAPSIAMRSGSPTVREDADVAGVGPVAEAAAHEHPVSLAQQEVIGPAAASRATTDARQPGEADARRARPRGQQLGFGFSPSSRGVLQAARDELHAILDALREDEVASPSLTSVSSRTTER